MQITSKLRRSSAGYIHYCPACDGPHSYITDPGHNLQWKFDGNLESPSFSPSYKTFDNNGTICHTFVTAGKLIFCGDCPNDYAGKTIDLPDLPDWMQGDGYGDGNP